MSITSVEIKVQLSRAGITRRSSAQADECLKRRQRTGIPNRRTQARWRRGRDGRDGRDFSLLSRSLFVILEFLIGAHEAVVDCRMIMADHDHHDHHDHHDPPSASLASTDAALIAAWGSSVCFAYTVHRLPAILKRPALS